MAQHLIPLVLIVLFAGTQGGPVKVFQNGRDSQAGSISGAATETPVPGIFAAQFSTRILATNDRALRRRLKNRALETSGYQERSVEDILTDKTLWGEGFPSALASLLAFSRAGEKQVWVFPDRILGRNKYANREQADRSARRLAEELKAAPKLTPRSARLKELMANGVASQKAEAVLFPEDRSYRIAAMGDRYLAPRLTINDVRKRLGKEERVTTELLDDGTDRRPIILTLHHYAGGAIIFVESDWNPNIGSVDRVFLDPSKISATLFEEAK